MSTSYQVDADEIRKALTLYMQPGQVTELRVLNCQLAGEWRAGTYSGYFDYEHIDALIDSLGRIERASACYFVPNACNPALLARSYNRARLIKDKEPTTGNGDILARRWLLIDVDAVRPSGVSATDAERDSAAALAVEIDYHLWEQGYPAGVISDSGNGAHVCLPIDLPADDGGLVERMLKSLAVKFDTAAAKVDISVHNAARIWKLPGTLSCKGDHAAEIGRPWRMARIVQVCKEVPENA